jgi:threonine/homoserine/homoserine lactone efflux protein
MFDSHPLLLAVFTGFVSGFLLSVPVGPVNLSIINEGARRGLLWASMIGLGAVIMEVLYCGLAFTGFASLFTGKFMKGAMEIFSFIFMLYLGIRFISMRTLHKPTHVETRIQERLKPHSAFAIGFVRVMGNPGVFLFWIVLAASFISRGWVEPTWPGKLSCVAGVGLGTGVWFAGLSYAASCGHGKFEERTLLKIEHGSGICLLCLAAAHGAHIVWQMVHHTL